MSWSSAPVILWQLALLAVCSKAVVQSRPNLILVIADDQGWNNVGFHNSNLLTPHTNELVSQGIALNRHYVYKFCSPTRCSALSGRLPIHVNQENSATEQPLAGIPLNMTAFPARLKEVGYKTHQIGKWHAGQASPDHIPTGKFRGFDTALSFFDFGEDHYTQERGGAALSATQVGDIGGPGICKQAVDLYGSHGPAYNKNGSYGGFTFTSEAVARIEAHDPSTPLFMYIAFQNIHPPLQVPEEYKMRYSEKAMQTTVNGMISFLDESLGNVTAALKRKGLWENTLLIYTPDNGGYQGNGGDDTPLRGGKFSDYDGGTRVGAFASGGFLPKAVRGTTNDGLIHVADWYATFCALAGVQDATDSRAAAAGLPPLDSLDVGPLLLGQNKTSPRTEIVLSAFKPGDFASDQERIAKPMYFGKGEGVVAGPDSDGKLWKLITGTQLPGPFGKDANNSCADSDAPGWSPKDTGVACTCGLGCLYELTSDETESHNVASKFPEVLKDMQARLRRAQATVYAPYRGDPDPEACTANDKSGGFWSPWLPSQEVDPNRAHEAEGVSLDTDHCECTGPCPKYGKWVCHYANGTIDDKYKYGDEADCVADCHSNGNNLVAVTVPGALVHAEVGAPEDPQVNVLAIDHCECTGPCPDYGKWVCHYANGTLDQKYKYGDRADCAASCHSSVSLLV